PIRRMARHPLARAVRVDRLTLAALEAALRERLLGIPSPVQRMLAARPQDLRLRAGALQAGLAGRGVGSRLVEARSAAGGGSLPEHGLPTVLLAVEGPASRLAAALRRGEPPVLARIEAGRCCIDPRTLLPGQDEALLEAIAAA